jgi:excisionase family DNA binding protein
MLRTPEVAELLGVSQRTVLKWVERGYLDVRAHGHGSKRQWAEVDVERAKLIKKIEPLLRVEVLREIGRLWSP